MKKGQKVVRWGYVFFEDNGAAPVREWLLQLSDAIRTRLFEGVDAALLTKLPPRAYLPNRFESMKNAQGIDMSQYHEALARDADLNYRLFCRFDSSAEAAGVGAPVLVLLDGKTKPRHAAMPTAEYQAVKDLWPYYYRNPRRCTPVEYPPIRVKVQPKKVP